MSENNTAVMDNIEAIQVLLAQLESVVDKIKHSTQFEEYLFLLEKLFVIRQRLRKSCVDIEFFSARTHHYL